MLILIITLLTLIFGVIAYFLYKSREKKNKKEELSYEDVLHKLEDKYVFFE
jgi:biopolymer transport protein ExbB/TolQ